MKFCICHTILTFYPIWRFGILGLFRNNHGLFKVSFDKSRFLHKFAVELHEFLDGEAHPVYQDPNLFFKNTFLTSQMKLILKDSLLRLSKGLGTPVTIIDTGFGGGKTHTIQLLHHIYNNEDLGSKYISHCDFEKEFAISTISDVRMITIDCRAIKKIHYGARLLIKWESVMK